MDFHRQLARNKPYNSLACVSIRHDQVAIQLCHPPRTKPDMSCSLNCKRPKPLRTYGRHQAHRSPRSSQARTAPSASLKNTATEQRAEQHGMQCLDSRLPAVHGDAWAHQTTPAETEPQPALLNRNSILNFFKPVPSTKTRQSPTSADADGLCLSHKALLLPQWTLPSHAGAQDAMSMQRQQDAADATLQDQSDSSLSSKDQDLPTRDLDKSLLPTRSKRKTKSAFQLKRSKVATVQTTLNLSTKAPFAECKVCDTVWNPLYPGDVKYHSRRHATVLRAMRRKQDDL
ncbi:hypothetical protein CDD82_3721 [Ophiocordyceps australis]|uniref:N-acetyltransferase ESCO zinc-finger domain-containing protein n=1 Tax=Ophiocordyceps australis TaxID=1399860 RepID=A0A2C5ZTB7_9HYPO|nr:hypothetical protein CDD82_3721 [Ophiocordyceps australis]